MESQLMMNYGRFIYFQYCFGMSKRWVQWCGAVLGGVRKFRTSEAKLIHISLADTFYEPDSMIIAGDGEAKGTWIIHHHEHLWFNSIFFIVKIIFFLLFFLSFTANNDENIIFKRGVENSRFNSLPLVIFHKLKASLSQKGFLRFMRENVDRWVEIPMRFHTSQIIYNCNWWIAVKEKLLCGVSGNNI